MAGFLRKKTRNKEPAPTVASNRDANLPSTPIFAKLATSLTRNAARSASPTLTVVSHPMALGSSGPLAAPTLGAGVANRQLPKHHSQHGTQRTGVPADPQQAHFSRMPSAASQPSKTFRRVSALEEKPLPVPVPMYDDPSSDSAPAGTQVEAKPARPLPLTPSHRAPPSHSIIAPPSAFDSQVQRDQRSASVDLPQKVQGNLSFDQQRRANMAPPDNAVVDRHSRSHSHRLNMRRLTNDIQSLPIRHQTEGTNGLALGSSQALRSPSHAHKHIVGQPARAGNQQTRIERMDNSVMLRVATTVDELTPSTSALRDGEAMLESKMDIYGDSATSSGQTNSHHRIDAAHLDVHGFGNPNDTHIHHGSILDRPLPSRPVTIDQCSENGHAYIDATGEISQTPLALGAEEPSPEFMLYRRSDKTLFRSLPYGIAGGGNRFSTRPIIRQSSLTAENRLPSAPQTSTLQNYEDFTVASDSNNMGVAVSFPDAQVSSPMSKYESRVKHLPCPTEGQKMRNGHQGRDHHQPFNPYQELSQAPQFTSRVRGKPLIFAAMEANIDQQQPGEEQTFSVRVWDGQDHSLGQHLGGYMVSPPPPDQKRAAVAEGGSRNAAASYPSPPPSEFPLPRAGKNEGQRESLQASPSTAITPTKSRKLSKARHSADMRHGSRPTTPIKARPLTPVSPALPAKKPAVANIPGPSVHSRASLEGQEVQAPPSRHGTRCSGMSLLGVDDGDPFAKTECVKVMAPHSTTQEKESREREKDQGKEKQSKTETKDTETLQGRFEDGSVQLKKQDSDRIDGDGEPLVDNVKADIKSGHNFHRDEGRISRSSGREEWERKSDVDVRPTSPISFEDRPQDHLKRDVDPIIAFHLPSYRRKGKDSSFHLVEFISRTRLLSGLLTYLSFYDWCILSSVSKQMRTILGDNEGLRETVLERFLKTVGYAKWCWDGTDPLPLSLQDLSDYMYGVSTPNHEYARVANLYVKSLTLPPAQRDPALYDTVGRLTAATRAYSRMVLRLRAQAEKDAASRTVIPVSGRNGYSRPPSRASSPTHSTFSHGHSQPTHPPFTPGIGFRSPLFRPKRAPLLRVFVPSPDGDWLSDKSVLECEEECRRAGTLSLMRFGDVVWDMAVGDEGNVGKLIWDGSYLIDLDYSYSPVGDLPKYVPALAFPPSYFHKVIRTGSSSSNPIVHIDLSPWGEHVATNLQLLQDRVKTETPQGAFHNVVRWVHRSSFVIRPSVNSARTRGSIQGTASLRVPIPETHGLFVDPGWYGTIIVETEGTTESLADLQDRCGPGVFPPRAKGVAGQMGINPAADARKVFRVIREKSRPGEIWIKAVSIKEKLL
ncbi:hypothetical protein APHAL10511_004033 [Amanita phalloides]|nr:hypothetical protein APHAL10511_004033 [Amanita phalloides]